MARNLKKLSAIMLCVALLVSLAPAAFAASVEITDAQGLMDMAKDPEGHYVLGADIDLGDVNWKPFPFAGIFDGAGHSILNLTLTKTGDETETITDAYGESYEASFAGLFSRLDGAVVKNLTIRGAYIDVSGEYSTFAGMIAGYGTDVSIRDCTVEYSRLRLTENGHFCGVGGILGYGNGEFEADTVSAELVLTDTNMDRGTYAALGGVCAFGFGDVRDSSVTLDGYASVYGYGRCGGLFGTYYVYHDSFQGTVEGNTVGGALSVLPLNGGETPLYDAFFGERISDLREEKEEEEDKTENVDAGLAVTEVTDQETPLSPEKCKTPAYKRTVTEETCTELGYSDYLCAECDYSFRGGYTLPHHTEGEWVTVKEAKVGEDGLRQLPCVGCGEILAEETIPAHVAGEWMMVREPSYELEGLESLHCADCGDILEERPVPALIPASRVELSQTSIHMDYKGAASIGGTVFPENAENTEVYWDSDDIDVVHVDSQGELTAMGRGTAHVKCTSQDGFAWAECEVIVDFTWWQWVIWTVGFGFLWY